MYRGQPPGDAHVGHCVQCSEALSLADLALAAFIVIGFSRTFYLRFLSDLPPLRAAR